MVVKCSHCFGLMRVDDARIPPEKAVRVRCPHCRGIGTVGPLDTPSVGEERGPDIPKPLDPMTTTGEKEPPSEKPPVLFDPLDDIRFPEEPRSVESAVKPDEKWRTIAIWVGVSLAVVGIFALLVNLLLPGPGPRQSATPTEHIEPQDVPQPDGLLGVGTGLQKPKAK